MKKQLLFAFGAAALLASCSNDIDSPVGNVNDGYLHVNGTISELNKTRATETNFLADDEIGVTGGTSSNVKYTYNGTTFTADEGIKLTAETSFTAYYPYQASVEANTINFDVTNQSNVDFLFASAQTASPDSPTVTFSFSHKMSQIALTVKDQTTDQVVTGQPISITLKKVAVTGSFNTTTGAVVPGTANGTLEISGVEVETASTVIVPSFESNNTNAIDVVVAVNDKTYTGSITPVLAAGNRYSFDLNIVDGATPEDPELVITGSITGWTDNDGNGQDLEEEYVLQVGDFLLDDGNTKAPNDSEFETFKDNIVGVVFYIENPCPYILYAANQEKDILYQDFYKNDSKENHGLAIALNNANTTAARFNANSGNADLNAWFTGDGASYSTNYLNYNFNLTKAANSKIAGYNNTKFIEVASNNGANTGTSAEGEGILKWVSDFNSNNNVDNASDWYLPSYAELSLVLSNYDVIKSSITKAGGELTPYDYNKTDNAKGTLYWSSDLRGTGNAWFSPMKTVDDEDQNFITRNSNNYTGWFRMAIAF